ncbi:MAG: type II toxin-antitoxin system RelE/ParE family toxin [Acetobacteraceae bacterium]|nr:type II toxin-antitoxin system RelE/ParE family toxin [Acetobacteraceae bacterium]
MLGIRDACQALADGSRQGRPIDAIRPGYRKLAVASHLLLFYRVTVAGVIDVVRILHQRMDAAAHL